MASIKDQIRAEIERRKNEWQALLDKGNAVSPKTVQELINEDLNILTYLDTLPEQPVSTIMTNEMLMGKIQPEQPVIVIKKSNALFDECVKKCDPAIMKEVSDNVDKKLGRQPVEGLYEEVNRYYSDNFAYLTSDQPTLSIIANIARHFAEWGAKHLKK